MASAMRKDLRRKPDQLQHRKLARNGAATAPSRPR